MPWFDFGGDGRPVLLVHGGVRSHEDWAGVLPVLLAHHRVVAIDLRGHGASTEERFDLSASVEDLRGVVRELGLDDVVIVGHSLGGVVALTYAVRGGACGGLVIVDALSVSVPAVFPGPDGTRHRQAILERVAAFPERSRGREPDASIAANIHDVDVFDLTARSPVPVVFVLATERPELHPGDDADATALAIAEWRRAGHAAIRAISDEQPTVHVATVACGHAVPRDQPELLIQIILGAADQV